MSPIFVHLGLTVADLARSRRFYEDALGFRYDRELHLAADQLQPLLALDRPSSLHAVYLQLGNITLELMEWQPSPRNMAGQRTFIETGLTHISVAVADLDAALNDVVGCGGAVLSRIDRAAMVRDPDGQMLELLARSVHDEIEDERANRTRKQTR